jgi:hypothetical protein
MIEVEMNWITLLVMSGALASVHLWFPWFDVRYAQGTSFWMGLIGGIAAGYVILYLLPKIARLTAKLSGLDAESELNFLDFQMYFLMLAGMSAYLVMLHLDTSQTRWSVLASAFDYLVHGAYSLLLGYVFVEMASEKDGINALVGIIFAMHLLGMNHVLRAIRTTGFDSAARWAYFLLVLVGAGLGLTTELPDVFVHSMTAFLAGIILVFVISEELPLKYRGRVPWFLLGAALFIVAMWVIIQFDPRPAY